MKFFVIFFASLSLLYGSNLLTYNIYERSDRIDIILSFDAPYEGSISQKNDTSSTTLTLSDLNYDRLIEKSINSPIIQELTINPEGKNLKVTLKGDKRISVVASKTVDGFGLRIRGTHYQGGYTKQPLNGSEASGAEPLAHSASFSVIDGRYISVIIVLLILVLLMLWIRKRLASNILLKKNVPHGKEESWLFHPQTSLSEEVNILHKKPLDANNSVVLFEYKDHKYLVVTGSTNVLLERFYRDELKEKSDFEKLFEENKRRLDEYLQVGNTQLDNYKHKASIDRHHPLSDD